MLKQAKITALSFALLFGLAGCETKEIKEEFRIAEIKPINSTLDVELVWRESAGDGVDNYFSNLSPAAVGDLVFAASRDGEVIAFNKDSGDEVWSTDVRDNPPTLWDTLTFTTIAPEKLSGGITAAYKNLYIGTENGDVIALSQATGEILWRTEVKGEVVAPPAAGEGWIAVTTAAGFVAALHPDTGELRWQIATDVPALSLRGTSSPTIAGGGVLVGTATGKLSVIILEKGIPAWEQAIGVVQGSTELEQLIDADSKPLINGSTVYTIAYNGNLAALDMMSGRVLWKREYSSYRNLAIDTGVIYLTDAKGNVIAVDANSGIEKWTSSELYNRRLTQPVVYKGNIVVGDYEGYFHFINKESGKIAARYKFADYDRSVFWWFVDWFSFEEDGAYTKPVVSGDKLFVQTRDGKVNALRLP
ncbi:outer membrane protein assembly factor BamB [uncultured Psychrosphaera sp.]|jgi:outer membrane protein assembly factor BamB|uniref:outer membrane protein assembly factor BamB n=1 Tax=uncultured Psychrosphaera sp. TaxID=1403522 RepID=UPI0030F80B60